MKHKEKAVFVAFSPALALASVWRLYLWSGPGPLTVHSWPEKNTQNKEEKGKRLGATV